MTKRRSAHWWLLAAVVLLGLAGWLMRACGNTPEVASRPPPDLPRAMRPSESNRMTGRQVLPMRSPQAQHHRDPVLSALSAPDAGVAVVFEANALRYSPVGQLLLNCFASLEKDDAGHSPLDAVRAQGLDPLQDLDRVGFADDNVVLSGDFSRVQWEAMASAAEPYGAQGQIRTLDAQASGSEGPVLATWGTQLVMVSPSRAVAMATLDRIEGRSPTAQVLSDNQAYGDMYGVVSGAAFGSLFGSGSPLSAQLQSAASSVEFHLDATHDVGLVATASGDDADKLQDLSKTFGGAIALARSQAVLRGDTVAAELLESAEVQSSGGRTVELEMAVPLEVLRTLLASCGQTTGDAGR